MTTILRPARWTFAFAFFLVLALTSSVLVPRCLAQAVSIAQVSGVISDPSGGVIPNAQVKITQTATQVARTVATDAQGRYTFPALPIGPYRLEVTASGFKAYAQSGIILQVGDNVQINVVMQVGAISETIEVAAQAEMVQTRDNTVSQVIDERRIMDLPLNGRVPTQLIVLAGASVYNVQPANQDVVGSKNFFSSVTVSLAGGQINSVDYLLDGGDNNDAFTNVNLPFPFPDALQEFSVQTSSLPARYGLRPAGVVNAVTKSGTNSFHGNVFEFLRNGDLNARNFFATAQDSLKRNQFGGTFGGPLIKDRLFFFGGTEITYNRQDPPSTISYVPTQAVLNGDFSAIDGASCVSGGKAKTILDPLTGLAFTNNQIPTTRFNQQALNLLKLIPLATNPCGKITYGIPTTGDEQQVIGRMDWVQSAKHNLYGRYFIDDYNNPAYYDGTNLLTTAAYGNTQRAQTFTLGDTYAISNTTLNSFHATWTRRRNNRGSPPNDINPSTLGINVPTPVPNFIQVAVSGYFTVGCGTCANAWFNVNTVHLADDVDIVRGKHQIGFGVDYMRNQFNSLNIWNSNGSFSANGQYASGKTMNDALAAFMLGYLSDYTQSANLQNATRATVIAFYVQDSIRLSPHLTFNAGLRWDPTLTPYDLQNRGESFSQDAFNAGQRSTVYTNAPPGLLFYGDPGIPPGFQNHHLLNFSPRIGFAWDPTGKGRQTIRFSSALLRDSEELFYNERQTTNTPYGTSIDQPFPAGGLTNPWQGYAGGTPFPLPSPIPKTYTFPSAGSYVGLPLDMEPPYMVQWSLSYQQQFGQDWMASATLLGNKTTHVWAPEDMNPAVYIPGSSASTNLRRRLYLQNPTYGAAYAQYTFSDQNGNANYNALLISLQHRFSQNFSILTNYTWSHCISDMDFRGELSTSNAYQNPNYRAGDRGNCGFDMRHQMNTSMVAVSPVKGNGAAGKLLANWQLSPMVSIHTGLPIYITDGTDISQTSIGNDRPNVVTNTPYLSSTNPVNYLDRTAFATQAAGTFGNLGRNTLFAPGTISFDLAFSRAFHLSERLQWLWRFEAFNVINHTNFNAPNATLSNSQFGVISAAGSPRILQFAMKLTF
jgi:hypothetical protein